MIDFTNYRKQEVTLILNTCSLGAVRMYQTLELLRYWKSDVTDNLRMSKLAELANVPRQKIYDARDELIRKELIEVVDNPKSKRGYYKFRLLMWEIIAKGNGNIVPIATAEPDRQYTEAELAEAVNRIPF